MLFYRICYIQSLTYLRIHRCVVCPLWSFLSPTSHQSKRCWILINLAVFPVLIGSSSLIHEPVVGIAASPSSLIQFLLLLCRWIQSDFVSSIKHLNFILEVGFIKSLFPYYTRQTNFMKIFLPPFQAMVLFTQARYAHAGFRLSTLTTPLVSSRALTISSSHSWEGVLPLRLSGTPLRDSR